MTKGKDLEYIINLETELSQIQDFDVLLERILFEARKVLRADAGSIYTTIPTEDPNVEKLSFRYSQNDTLQKNIPPGQKLIYSVFTLPINEKSVSGYCALTKTLINIPDMYNISKDAPYSFNPSFDKISGYKSTSTLTVPLVSVNKRIMGVIQVLNAIDKKGKVRPFSTGDEVIITHFAAKAVIALERASTTRAMILRMIKMSVLRDPKETGTHVNRVAGYSLEIYDRWAYRHNIPKKGKREISRHPENQRHAPRRGKSGNFRHHLKKTRPLHRRGIPHHAKPHDLRRGLVHRHCHRD